MRVLPYALAADALQGARNLGPREDEFEGFTFQDGGAMLQATHADELFMGAIGEESSILHDQ